MTSKRSAKTSKTKAHKKAQKIAKSSKPHHYSEPAIKRTDPIKRLTDDCLDLLFSLTPVVDLIKMRSVSKLWRDSIDWRLGDFYFQKKHFPEFAAAELSPNTDIPILPSRDGLSKSFRRNVYINTIRTRSTATSVKKFTNIFYHSQWFHSSWAICGDYFVWMGENHLNIQRVFGVGDDKSQPVRSYQLLEKYLAPSNFSSLGQAIQPESCGFGSEGEPLLALVVYQKTNRDHYAWRLGGRVIVINVVTGRRLWHHETPRDMARVYAAYPLQHYTVNSNIFVWTYKILYPRTSYLDIMDIQTGKRLLRVDGLEPITCVGGPETPTGTSHAGIWAHPRRNLIFCTLVQRTSNSERMGILCADTGKWVAMAELPAIQLKECPTCHGPASRSLPAAPPTAFPINFTFGCVLFEESAPKYPDVLENFYIREYRFSQRCDRRSCPIPEYIPIYTFKIPPQEELKTKDVKDIWGTPSLLVERIELFNIDHNLKVKNMENVYLASGSRTRPYIIVNPITKVACRLQGSDRQCSLVHINLKLEPEMDVLAEHKSSVYSPQATSIKKLITKSKRNITKSKKKITKSKKNDQKAEAEELAMWKSKDMIVQALNEKYHVYATEDAAFLLSYEPKW